MLQRIRESLTLVLIAALPFHAFLVTVGTKLIAGSGHAPLTILALWKEALLAVVLMIAFVEWLRKKERRFTFDDIDILLIGLVVLSIIITAVTHSDWRLYLFGFRYDFIPLLAFFALRRVGWSAPLMQKTLNILVVVGIAVATYGFAAMFLPQAFFTWLGYSDLHSLYLPDAPLAAFQQIGDIGIRRMQSVMSGPNQLGLWLLIPWSVAIINLLRRRVFSFWFLVVGLFGVAILLTFSRSAWIAAAVIAILAYKKFRPAQEYRRFILQLATFMLEVLTLAILFAPSVLVRATSSFDHLRRPLEAIAIMREHPFGLGLGIAGPASNRVSEACVHLEPGSDYSWAGDRPDLCVFVGATQVQPLDHRCACPLLPESWYLQLGVELGLIGFVLFITIVLFVLRALKVKKGAGEVYLIFLGVSVAALLLHAWEDSAVAYTIWILAAAYGSIPGNSVKSSSSFPSS